MTPYQVLYGRDRPMAGVPYELPPRAEDAVAFFERQRKVDQQIAATLNQLHAKQAAQVNRRRKELSEFQLGDRVWYLRPRDRPGEKLESYWLGPAVVHDRQGEHSYLVKLDENRFQEVHRDKLKAYHTDDSDLATPVKNFHFKSSRPQPTADIDSWTVEEVVAHRQLANGDLEFQVK